MWPDNREWLVTDQRGAFAMGTPEGIRSRKYHGFFQGIVGRSESAFLSDLELKCDGQFLWPHLYSGPEGQVISPDPANIPCRYSLDTYPSWRWKLSKGEFCFRIAAGKPGGIALEWSWHSRTGTALDLVVRPLFAMRELHGLGGRVWNWKSIGPGRAAVGPIAVSMLGDFEWVSVSNDLWYRDFHYTEEAQRGYPAEENLYSAGILKSRVQSGGTCALILAEDPADLRVPAEQTVHPALDFVLTRPAGVVAGFPWFGEWGRDTFVALPGIVAAWIGAGGEPSQVWSWASEVLLRWGEWIGRKGMLPNCILKQGEAQWESADATLWWCHALASLWFFSVASDSKWIPESEIRREFRGLLSHAIDSIRTGGHLHLLEDSDGMLEVTTPHSTWMDARVDGVPVTPRGGRLPEINALWFQARCLQLLWLEASQGGLEVEQFEEVAEIGRRALECVEPDRPNSVFLHSIPLAPSFVLGDHAKLTSDLGHIGAHFWTPVGLRTLIPSHPAYKPHCMGEQSQRDRSYHQGPAWAWLGGHYEMARMRIGKPEFRPMFPKKMMKEVPIEGHVPELFDAEPPFTPRGAPAQAWSMACLEEAVARKKLRGDSKLTKILARRWIGRRRSIG